MLLVLQVVFGIAFGLAGIFFLVDGYMVGQLAESVMHQIYGALKLLTAVMSFGFLALVVLAPKR